MNSSSYEDLNVSAFSTGPENVYGYLIRTHYLIAKYVWLVPVVLGIPGNIISALVATKKENRNVSTCIFMTALAIADTCLLLQPAWRYPVSYWGLGKYITKSRDLMFKFYFYFNFTFGMSSGVFLAIMSVDRLTAVRFPMAARRLCTVARAKKAVLVAFLVVVILNLNIFYTYRYIKDPDTGVEILIISVPGQPIIELLASGNQLILGALLPFIVISISNLIIIITVKQASKRRRILASDNKLVDRHQRETQYLTRMLIFVCVAYIITSIPLRLYHLIMDIPEIDNLYDMDNTYWNIRYNIQNIVLYFLWCCNYGLNFYLYILGGGKRYRKDTREVLAGCLFCKKAKDS